MFYSQKDYDIRFEWGEQGLAALAPISDVVIIVDVLSFSTCVDIAVQRGATVFPFPWKDERAREYAESVHAELAGSRRGGSPYSLSPASMLNVSPDTRLVLPSPNGATLSLSAQSTPVLAGCLRNIRAVASAAKRYGSRVAVIAAGERWKADNSLRPSFEDLVGAGAIIRSLDGSISPEAFTALAAFQGVEPELGDYLMNCSSGKELIERGFPEDVRIAAQINISDAAPLLMNGAFIDSKP